MQYMNPVIRGFHPDPSICRVGQDYYLAVSSFACFPALPVYHSRDLVNWEHAGNAQSFGDSLDLSEAGEEGGVWAPTLRWHDDMFFIAVSVETRAGEFANLLLHAREASGPWSVPVRVDVGGIDPSLFFEDGNELFLILSFTH